MDEEKKFRTSFAEEEEEEALNLIFVSFHFFTLMFEKWQRTQSPGKGGSSSADARVSAAVLSLMKVYYHPKLVSNF